MISVTDNQGQITTFEYDAVGNQTHIRYPNGLTSVSTFDSLNRVTAITTLDADDNVITRYAYTLDATGRRASLTEHSGRVSTLTYDDVYRLTNESITDPVNGDNVSTYTYDATGNRTQSVINGITTEYVYDASDRLLSQGAFTYEYDAQGNMLSETDGNTGIINTYQYDANQRMVGFSDGRTADDAQDITYRYNPDGIRTKTIIGGSSTDYIVDSNRDYAQVIAEQVNNVDIAKEYVFGDDLLSQNTAALVDDSVDGVAEGADSGETQTNIAFYHYDSLGTTRNLSNDSGTITDDYFYEAFGDLLASTGTTDNDYLYTGEQYDAALDNYYLRARYYHQGVGRFTQMDEWYGKPCTPLTLNKYLYVHSDPLNGIDLSGYMRISDVKVASYGQAKIRTATVESRVSVFSGKTKGRQVNLKRQVGCFIGKQFIDAKRDKVEGHHPLQQSIGGAERQVLLSTAKMTHQLLHTVQNMLFREAGLPPLNTSAARFESFFSSNPGTRRLAFNTAITAAKRVDQFCGYKGKTSFESNIKREMKRWIKSNDLL